MALAYGLACASACGGRVVVDGGSASSPPDEPNSCAVACGAVNPSGMSLYNVVESDCFCPGCHACELDACTGAAPPTNACLPCVQAALASEHCALAGLFQSGCISHPECSAFVACLESCS